MLIWGGASPAWLAEFDWVIVSWKREDNIRDAKQINPNLIASGTADHNACERTKKPCPIQWQVPKTGGGTIPAYGERLGDTSDFAGKVNGLNYRDAIIADAKQVDWTLWDGWNSDGLWGNFFSWKSGWDEADVDRDGDHDSADDQAWEAGRLNLFRELDQAIPSEKIITAWAGAPITYFGQGPNLTNGNGGEKFLAFSGWDNIFNTSLEYEGNNAPDFHFVNGHNEGDKTSSSSVRKSKENYRFMRFGLGTALVTGAYYSYEDATARQNEHMWVSYYDEYDTPLGYPLAPVYEIRDHVYTRFFDGGVVILNASMSDETVDKNDLRQAAVAQGLDWNTISGGAYYRFQGQQDPGFNNGQRFSSITLPGEDMGGNSRPKGDSIILTKGPATIVTPIIVDTEKFASSPGVSPATLSGFSKECGATGNAVTGFRPGYPWCSSVNPIYGYSEASTGSGASATFKATLVNGGKYEVYEYHPGGGSKTNAFDVPHKITYAGGQDTIKVDQRVNGEQWNLLGTYNFNANQVAKVVISGNAQGSTVSADAIMFKYLGNTVITPPPPPFLPGDIDGDGDVDIFDYNLLVTNFGNTNCSNIADIDGNCKVDIFDYNILVENFGRTG